MNQVAGRCALKLLLCDSTFESLNDEQRNGCAPVLERVTFRAKSKPGFIQEISFWGWNLEAEGRMARRIVAVSGCVVRVFG